MKEKQSAVSVPSSRAVFLVPVDLGIKRTTNDLRQFPRAGTAHRYTETQWDQWNRE